MGIRRYHALEAALLLGVSVAYFAETPLSAMAQTSLPSTISLPTELRVQTPGWWPTKGESARDEYVGAAQCTKCHASKAASYPTTAMARAGVRATISEGLRQHDPLIFQLGPYSYQILAGGDSSILSVSDGTSALSHLLLWAFGVGHMGQTYVYEQNGNFYESHLSFFSAPQALDITAGQPRSIPASLEDAAGRRMKTEEARVCFGCHTTASTTKNHFDPSRAFPGVTCEGCHGPGAKHIAAMESGRALEGVKLILNPGRLTPVDSVDFCGACHRTWEDVVNSGSIGIGVYNVRFAPYRLENSRCWATGDARITCIACHDPHEPLGSEPGSYDSRCFQCHAERGTKKTRSRPGAACPVGTSNCVSCHMPRYSPPDLHSAFTDHWIRIVRPGKPYPN